ncbi:MAG: GGDEF domain-containing protein [Alphaproteobacteria bacterium]|nr:GGDEF domain-containing protein [Alphaproteobacteria bacterium]
MADHSFTRLFFGSAVFREGLEYQQFRYRFALAILVFSTVITGLFLLTSHLGTTQFDERYLLIAKPYFISSLICYVLLRARPSWMTPITVLYAVESLLQFAAVFFLNPSDELRIIWFALNLPGVYLILGQFAGIVVTVVSILFVTVANAYLDQPYSINAIVTICLGMVYISIFFHAFATRSISFHHAMVEANRKLSDMAAKDPLTGLLNARAYYALCDNALSQARRSGNYFAMLFVDLDHFKSINDRFGHEAGDAVLKSVAGCLQDGIRHSDIVGRIGGEEFSVLLPDTDQEGARQLAEKLRQDIEALMPDIGEQRLPITASIGVAAGGPEHKTVADVQRQADQAMYVAKRQGRNRVTCLDEIMDGQELASVT